MDIFWECTFIILQLYGNTLALVRKIMDHGIIVAAKLCNLISLPDSEMDREPQHAGKAGVGSTSYDLLRGNIDHGHIIVFDGAPQNPISIANFYRNMSN